MASLFQDLMEKISNRDKPLETDDPKEIAKRMVDTLKKYNNLELTDDEISQLEAAAGYFDDDED